MVLNCGVGEDSWESLGLQGDPTSPSYRRSVLGVHWKDWCWSWNTNTLATSCKELTHWKRPWCWERLGAGGEGDDRGWDGWMAPLTQWTWVWVNSGSWWWIGRPGVLWFMGLQRVGHDWATELTEVLHSFFNLSEVELSSRGGHLLGSPFPTSRLVWTGAFHLSGNLKKLLGDAQRMLGDVDQRSPLSTCQPCVSTKRLVSQGGNKSFKRLFENALWHVGLQGSSWTNGKISLP